MNTQRKTMDVGRTGFWMRVGSNLNVRVVNGTMYRLQNGKSACILIHILSPHFARQMFAAEMYRNGKFSLTAADSVSLGVHFGLFGLKNKSAILGWVSSTKLRKLTAQREQAAMSPSTYLNHPFSRLIGLKDGSASDTLKAFQKRRSAKPMQ